MHVTDHKMQRAMTKRHPRILSQLAMPLTIQDRLAIQELCACYYLTTDEADVDGFMDCWADHDDIRFESVFGTFEGRAAIRSFEDEHVHRGMAIGKRHLLTNVVVHPGEDEDTAAVTSYMTVVDVVNIPHIVATAIYRDSTVVRTDDGWKFVYRHMDIDPGFQKLMDAQDAEQPA
jgi:hypothetical protein